MDELKPYSIIRNDTRITLRIDTRVLGNCWDPKAETEEMLADLVKTIQYAIDNGGVKCQ